MDSRAVRVDTGINASFIVSAVIHLAVFLFLIWSNQNFFNHPAMQETYYVDVVNLPVASPQSGASSQKPEDQTSKLPEPTLASPVATTVPVKAVLKTTTKTLKPSISAPKESVESESEFAERMAKLSGKAEEQEYEERIKRMAKKNKATSVTKAGTPGASGTEAGSRYADFIKSRLEDALKITSSYSTKKPEVSVRLIISADGRLSRIKIERSSGDSAFELAVRRAIDLASGKFTPPPGNTAFENGFIFKPKGISNNSLR